MKNISKYKVPLRYSRWHCFKDTLLKWFIVFVVFIGLLAIILTATIVIWA